MNTAPPTPNANRIEILDDGKLRVAADFLPLLKVNGLDTFDRIMNCAGGEMIRSVPGRSTVKIALQKPHGGVQVVFLKRYQPEYLSVGKKLLRFLRWPGADDEGLHEWNAIEMLRAHGLNTAMPIAVGQVRHGGIVTRSFVMTAELDGECSHYHIPVLNTVERRAFARELGDLTRRFHDAGFVHKDYYLYHVFILRSPLSEGSLQLALIDLQRVVEPSLFIERWRVKDLAALAYSALKIGMPRTDLARFFRAFRGGGRLTGEDKSLARKILSRAARLNFRQPKYDRVSN